MTLEEVPSGSRVFVDAPIFIYHFTAVSDSCRELLIRCEEGDLEGLTSTVVLAEVAHRLMTIEAVARRLVRPGNVVNKLRRRPELVQELHLYDEQIEKIPLMSIEVVTADLRLLLRSAEVRREHGLLVNDSLVATAALEHGALAIASSDPDFDRVPELERFSPGDL